MKKYTLENLFNKVSLYDETLLSDPKIHGLILSLIKGRELKADLFCVECAKERVFTITKNDLQPTISVPLHGHSPEMEEFKKDPISYTEMIAILNPHFNIELACSNNSYHKYSLNLCIKNNSLIKTGQYPSIANVEKHNLEKYRKLLKSDYSNLSRAIGLHSHGIGVGSYVYLRRIFETMIEEKHIECAKESTWDEETYAKSRMSDKIKMLEHKLPELFKTAPALYGILSKGVHELSEDECREYFPVMRYAIELILDEKLAEIEANTKKDDLLKSINKIASNIQ